MRMTKAERHTLINRRAVELAESGAASKLALD
jgi:hypothetical protein